MAYGVGATESVSAAPAAAPSVLVVDDDEEVRETILDYAKSVGSEVWQASNGLEALWVVKHHRPTLVLLDLTMPRLDGFETIRHIRRFEPSIRIVVITGDVSEATQNRVAGLGVELLHKPFDLTRLDAVFGLR